MNYSLLFLGDIGGSELILIMVVILIFFGANKIPELARGLGKGIREFKDASSEIRNEFERAGQQPNPNQHYNPNQPQGYNPNQGQPYNPNYNPGQPQYDPNQPYQPQTPDYSQYQAPYQPGPPSGDYVAPVADQSAPAGVDLPSAQPTYHQSTPLPPTTDGVPGTRPRLDQQ